MKRVLLCVAFLLLIRSYAGAGELKQVHAALHLSTSASDGSYSPSQVVAFARQSGFSVVGFTDKELRLWEYGLWPLRHLLAISVEHMSIIRFGAERWLAEIAFLQAA